MAKKSNQVARNMKELEQMIMKEAEKALRATSDRALADMQEETSGYYTEEPPKMYVRTGALGDTPRTTPITRRGLSVFFDAYLDLEHRYTTGKKPTMLDVLKLTNNLIQKSSVGRLRLALGEPGYWEEAEKKMEESFKKEMKKSFEEM